MVPQRRSTAGPRRRSGVPFVLGRSVDRGYAPRTHPRRMCVMRKARSQTPAPLLRGMSASRLSCSRRARDRNGTYSARGTGTQRNRPARERAGERATRRSQRRAPSKQPAMVQGTSRAARSRLVPARGDAEARRLLPRRDREGDRSVPRGLLARPCRNTRPAPAPLGGVPRTLRREPEALSAVPDRPGCIRASALHRPMRRKASWDNRVTLS